MNQSKEKIAVLCDIDGTIADINHRLNFVNSGKKDWKTFFSLMSEDKPLKRNISIVLNKITPKNKLIFVTGRPDNYQEETVKWIEENTPFEDYIIFMRRFNDFREDVIVKKEMLDEIQEEYTVEIVFEDRIKLKEMWQKNGICCEILPDSN